MAAYNKNNVVLSSLIFIILLFWAPNAQPLLTGGGMNVTGANLTCCPGAPLSGAVMELNCTDISGTAGTVAQAVTDADGAFYMRVPPEAVGSRCTLSVHQAATTNCSLLSDGGPISGSVQIAVNGALNSLEYVSGSAVRHNIKIMIDPSY